MDRNNRSQIDGYQRLGEQTKESEYQGLRRDRVNYEEEDDDMLEAGEDYSDLLGVDFNYIETVFS